MWALWFVFGGWSFWALSLSFLLVLGWAVEDELGGRALLSVLIYILVIQFLSDVNIWAWVSSNPDLLLKYALIYAGVGILWSVVKFGNYTRHIGELLEEHHKIWESQNPKESANCSPEMSSYNTARKKMQTWREYCSRKSAIYQVIDVSTGKLRGVRDKICIWIAYWPTSCVWTLINDPIRKAANWIYDNLLIGMYDKIWSHNSRGLAQFEEDRHAR